MIADLAVNHVEKVVLLCSWSVERVEHDYGIDLLVFTYSPEGETEAGQIFLQVKGQERLKYLVRHRAISFRIEKAHLRGWLEEWLPVVLVVYDASIEVAYWLYVQAYFAGQPTFSLARAKNEVTVRIPQSNVLNQAAVQRFAGFRNAVLAQVKGAVQHHE